MFRDVLGEPNKRHGKLLLVNRPLQNREKWAIIRASCAWPDPNSGRRRRSIWGENLEPRVRALRLSLPHKLLVNSGGGRVLNSRLPVGPGQAPFLDSTQQGIQRRAGRGDGGFQHNPPRTVASEPPAQRLLVRDYGNDSWSRR
jgi:hypothetical protein